MPASGRVTRDARLSEKLKAGKKEHAPVRAGGDSAGGGHQRVDDGC